LKRDSQLLPPDTETVWEFLKTQPTLAGFVLIGGSALALRIRHRRSEDLDLVWLETHLPRRRLEALLRIASESGLVFEPSDDEAALHDFADGGLDFHDYQQNFLVNRSVKVFFFAPETQLIKVLSAPAEQTVRIATLAELFRAKCLVSAKRSKTRDWLDLYLLMRDHGFTIRDFAQAFREAGAETQCDTAFARLCSGLPQRDDEGYAHLLQNAPSLQEMTSFFVEQRNRLEIETAAEAKRRR